MFSAFVDSESRSYQQKCTIFKMSILGPLPPCPALSYAPYLLTNILRGDGCLCFIICNKNRSSLELPQPQAQRVDWRLCGRLPPPHPAAPRLPLPRGAELGSLWPRPPGAESAEARARQPGRIPGAWPRDGGADSGRNSVSFFVFKRNSPVLGWAGPSFIWFSSKAEP